MVIPLERRETLVGTVAIIADPAIIDPALTGGERIIDLPLVDTSEFSGLPSSVGVSNIGAFPPKQVFGDYNRTSHQILSSFGQVSWAGGGQRSESQESSDTDRFAELASLETRFPHALTLLPLTHKLVGPNQDGARIIGDLLVSGNREIYVSYGTAMRRIAGGTLAGSFTLPAVPVRSGTQFRTAGTPTLYIPLGTSGYVSFNGTTVSAPITLVAPLNFCVHDKKLWDVDINGNISKSTNGTTWTQVTQIEPEFLPRGVIPYFNRADELVPHCVTDSMVFSIDETNQVAYETDLNYAPHPAAGIAWDRWRTDLYVAIGLGIQRYTGSTINAVGLDRDDGVGFKWSGHITSLERGNNDLFVGLTADAGVGTAVSEFVVDEGLEVYLSGAAGRCTVNRITGAGIPHTLWVAPTLGGTVQDLTLSSAGGNWRLFWTWKGDVYYQDIAVGFDNPAQNPTQEFEATGELLSPWLDMGMSVDHMTLAALEFEVRHATATETITVDFQVDTDDLTEFWRPAVVLDAPGHYEVLIGRDVNDLPDGGPRYNGIGFFRFRYRLRLARDPSVVTRRPVLEAVIVAFIKRMRRIKSFTATIDCTKPDYDTMWGLSNRQRADLLDRLIESEIFVPFGHGDRWTMVKLAYATENQRSGNNFTGNVEISLVMPYEQRVGAVS